MRNYYYIPLRDEAQRDAGPPMLTKMALGAAILVASYVCYTVALSL